MRNAAAAVALTVLLAGTLWGEDDHFPFGPFRMYAYASATTGEVAVPALEAVTADGVTFDLRAGDLGQRRAELEGQLGRFEQDPALLGLQAEVYQQRAPGGPRLDEIRLVTRITTVRPGQRPLQEQRVLSRWQRGDAVTR